MPNDEDERMCTCGHTLGDHGVGVRWAACRRCNCKTCGPPLDRINPPSSAPAAVPGPEANALTRIAAALESIAASLERMSQPPATVGPETVQFRVQLPDEEG